MKREPLKTYFLSSYSALFIGIIFDFYVIILCFMRKKGPFPVACLGRFLPVCLLDFAIPVLSSFTCSTTFFIFNLVCFPLSSAPPRPFGFWIYVSARVWTDLVLTLTRLSSFVFFTSIEVTFFFFFLRKMIITRSP